MMWRSHKLRRREWRQPLKQNHLEKVGRELGKLGDLYRMRVRMWVLLQISIGREGHQISTLATWI